jgi:hypothetical protein
MIRAKVKTISQFFLPRRQGRSSSMDETCIKAGRISNFGTVLGKNQV